MDVFDLEALAGDVDPLALAAELRRKGAAIPALRRRENLAELGLLGGPDLAPMAQAMGQNARAQIGDANAERQMVLKRALWNQQKQSASPATEAMIAEAERLGIDRQTASMLTGPQLQGVLGAAAQRRAAAADRERADQTPAAMEKRAAMEEAAALETEKKRIEIAKGRRDLNTKPEMPRFGEEWEPLPSSPLIDNEQKRMAFIEAAGEAKEARRLAAELKRMVDAGLGPTSSAADKTKAESIVTRLQLIGKKVDALGVLSETDITKFIEPQLVNPASWKSAMQRGLMQFDPKAQLDQYLSNLDGKIEASARTWAVKRKGQGSEPRGSTKRRRYNPATGTLE